MKATQEQTAQPDYFADYSAWSQSMLKTFLDRRRLAEAYYVKRTMQEPQPTDTMRKGTATHTALLEPERFDSLVITYPKDILAKNGAVSTTEAKAFRDEHLAAGRVVLKDSEFAEVKAMAASVRRVCGKWMGLPGFLEEAVYWTDEDTGLALKSRLDWRIETDNANIVLDLKTTDDASPWAFRQRVKSCRYWMQDSQYRDAATSINGLPTQFYFAVVESSFPHACAIHRLDDSAANDARWHRGGVLSRVAECLKTGDWSEPWESAINELALPNMRDFVPTY